MKLKNFLPITLIVFSVIAFSGCTSSPAPSENAAAKPVEKIVALTASDCEIIYALGAGDMLVGRGTYCDYPPEILDLPVLQSGQNTNLEQIMGYSPDVVILGKMAQPEEIATALEKAGIKVVTTDANKIDDVYANIELLGTITGKNDEAAALVKEMQSTFKEVAEKVSEGNGKTVYFEVSPLEYGLWSAGKNTFMDEMAQILKVENTFSDVDGWAEVSEEAVIDRNPDYIVSITMYFGEGVKPVDEILGRTGWQDIKAVVNKDVINVDSDEISRPGPRLANAINTLYEFFYE